MSEEFTPEPTGSDRETADIDFELSFDATPEMRLDDVVGLEDAKESARSIVEPLTADAGLTTTSLLVHGPSGNGKSLFVNALCGELAEEGFGVGVLRHLDDVRGDEADVVVEAVRKAAETSPSVLVIDQFRQCHRDDILVRLRDEFARIDGSDARVLVVAIISDYHSMSTKLYPTPFEAAIKVDHPDLERACALLDTYVEEFTDRSALGADVDTTDEDLRKVVDGLTALELRTGTKQAFQRAGVAGDSTLTTETLVETLAANSSAAPQTSNPFGQPPSSTSDVDDRFVEETGVTFDDIGGHKDVKDELRAAVEYPERFEQTYDRHSLESAGVLLHGQPGNGKTMLAKALATEYDRTFITVEGPELQDKHVGQTEANIREVFETAREHAPSVVFFDEIDALAPNRNEVHASFEVDFVNTLLAELDGFESTDDVLVIGATNRPHALDGALLRKGRLERHIHVSTPDPETVETVVEAHAGDYPFADDVSVEWVAEQFEEGITAATVTGVCDHALRKYAMDRVAASGGDDKDLEIRRADVLAAMDDYPTDPNDDPNDETLGRDGFY